ncbi:crotonase/enoyl-CoA hydratase family protein [Corynebacterium sp. p3-SID1056]|uniref:crotonase/enoyl-CoA hydratase family protein n=1 Tax=Corynebacterium sp. p3-SID1056 TaxID=2916092 RepID=UPI0021A50EA3|nr:crotonase/enoyl-CoA hydratase family protein [Corynebacterium sp. p3-SID1056]MCT2338322.1 crotonase/enoyl-CoA hydratase family protein [Corynebacterium sp. p3-SID1056]
MSNDAALYEVDGHVATITLNRPDAMNAVNRALSTAVGNALEQANNDPSVHVIIITGQGRAFCAGADLKDIAAGNPIDHPEHPEWGFGGIAQHWSDKPVIAAVNGFALGGGFEIAVSCDLIVAAEGAKFGLPEVKRGLLAGAGGVVRTARQIPLRRALELVLTGDFITAETAAEWGLINRVVPADAVLDAARELAEVISKNAPLSVQYSKEGVHKATSAGSDWHADWSNSDPWQVNDELWERIAATNDAKEGATAFAEKREPKWSGS